MTKYCFTLLLITLSYLTALGAPGDPIYKTKAEVCRGMGDFVNLNDLFITDMGTTGATPQWWIGSVTEKTKIQDPTQFPMPQETTTDLYLGFRANEVYTPVECSLKSIPSSRFIVMNDTTICYGESVQLGFKDISTDVKTVTWTNLKTGETHTGVNWDVQPIKPIISSSADNKVAYLVKGESTTGGKCSNLSDTVIITVLPSLIDAKTKLITEYQINKGIINLNNLLTIETENVFEEISELKYDSDNPLFVKYSVTWTGVADPENYLLSQDTALFPVIDIDIDLCGGQIKNIASKKITIKAIGDDAYLFHESVSSPGNKFPNVVCEGDDIKVKVLAGTNDRISKVEWLEPAIPDANKTEVNLNEWDYSWKINTATKFKAKITLQNTLSYVSEITIDAKKVPTLIATPDTAVCNYPVNLIGLLNANNYKAGSVTWKPVHPATDAGKYTATATATYQCQSMPSFSITGDINVTTIDKVTLTAMDNAAICEGQSITLKAEVNSGSLTWSNTMGGSPLASTTITPAVGKTKYYVWTNSTCGIIYDSVTITVNQSPIFTLAPVVATLCEGEKVTLKSDTPTNVDSILWNINGKWINQMEIEVSPINSPTYTARGYKNNCYTEAKVSVSTLATPNLSVEKNMTVCSGSPLKLSATTTTTGALITWFEANETPLENNTIINNPVDGSTYRVEVSNGGLCATKETVTVKVLPIPSVVAMGDTAICFGSEVSLYTLSHEGTVTWDVPNLTFIPKETATYTVTASTAQCGTVTDRVTVTVHEQLYIRPETLPEYKSGSLYDVALQTNANTPNFAISAGSLPFGFGLSSWGVISGSANQGEIGDNAFTVKVNDDFGCSFEKKYSIKEDLRIPEVFSPNGDGINDIFMKDTEVVIFNRLGIKIYEGKDGWDGTFNGNTQPPDTYFYLITTVDSKGKKKKSTGSITIISR